MLLLSLAAATTCLLTTPTAESPRESARRDPSVITLAVDGVPRTAEIVIGKKAREALKATNAKVPLVYVWHGFGGKPKGMQRAFAPHLDDAIGVFPAGIGRTFPGFGKKPRPGWQISEHDLRGRDLKFFDALHKKLVDSGCVDESRVTSTGFSNGALFTNVLGCHRADTFAAIAPVSGAGPGMEARCKTPLPTLVVHGTKDRVLDFSKGTTTAAKWSAVNRCKSKIATPKAGTCTTGAECAQPLKFCAHGKGHTAPLASRKAVAAFLLSQINDARAPAHQHPSTSR